MDGEDGLKSEQRDFVGLVLPSKPANILYDLTTHAEWTQEIENIKKSGQESNSKSLVDRIVSAAKRSVGTFVRRVGYVQSASLPCNLPASLVELISLGYSWSIKANSTGEYVAVLQDNVLEIRSRRDNYESALARCRLADDSFAAWRCLSWSPDDTVLAVSHSSGSVTLFDIVGGEFLTTTPVKSSPGDLSCAIVSIIWLEPPKNTKWDARLMNVNRQGLLTCYNLLLEDGICEPDHEFTLSHIYPRGVSTAVHSQRHSLIIVGGPDCHAKGVLSTQAGQEGLTVWRMLSGSPYYKLVTDYDSELASHSRPGFLYKMSSAFYGAVYGDTSQEVVYRSRVSPDGQHLLTLSTESKLCLYAIPSLRRISTWSLDEQPAFNQISPSLLENPHRTKYLRDHPHYYKLIDVAWWDNQSVILVRHSGAVLVADITDLSNLLGEYPEWFESTPQVEEVPGGQFIALECESRVQKVRKRTVSTEPAGDGTEGHDSEPESDDNRRDGPMKRATGAVKELLQYITDSGEPVKRKTRLMRKTYRLISLKSTTPDELFKRKIDEEEYGEALALAKVYQLDSDLVYQKQWRSRPVSQHTINDYLNKIRKRNWVLQECLERVPEDIEAMRALLEFGLSGTDLEALHKIGQGCDHGRFIKSKEPDLDLSANELNPAGALEASRRDRRSTLLSQTDFSQLDMEQRELCRLRLRLLQYLDRLSTYEEILGTRPRDDRQFNAEFFTTFRAQNIVEAVTDFARVGDISAVECMFTYLGADLESHRLAILSNLPETLAPRDYKHLMPVIEGETAARFPVEQLRDADWVEERRHEFSAATPPDSSFLYSDMPEFRDSALTPDLLKRWYSQRAVQIEERSGLADNAREMLDVASENGVQGLEDLTFEMSLLEMFVYDCKIGPSMSLKRLRDLSEQNRTKLVMSRTPVQRFHSDAQRLLHPYLERYEARSPGSYDRLLLDFLHDTSISDLRPVFALFEVSQPNKGAASKPPLLRSEEVLLRAAIDAVYTTERDDQLSYILSILECLPKSNNKSSSVHRELLSLHNAVDEMERHIEAAERLEKYGINQTISNIRTTQFDVDSAILLMKRLTRKANNTAPPFSEAQWTELQSDMTWLQSQVYRSISGTTCCEIFVESLLCSGKLENIRLAAVYMDTGGSASTGEAAHNQARLDVIKSIEVTLLAVREYFNSSGSYDDPSLRLARACLDLFNPAESLTAKKPGLEELAQEADLLAALSLLNDFKVIMLPLHIRLLEDRLDLIRQCLDISANNYKHYPKLLKLCSYLRVSDCATLRMITQKAVERRDGKFALKQCKLLMEKMDPEAWKECHELATSGLISNIDDRMSLLSYALVHCDDNMIEQVLRDRTKLKSDILLGRISREGLHSKTKVAEGTHRDEGEDRDSGCPESTEQQSTAEPGPGDPQRWTSVFGRALGAVRGTTLTTLTQTSTHALSSLSEGSTKALSSLTLSSTKALSQVGKTISMFSSSIYSRSRRDGSTDDNDDVDDIKQIMHPFYEDLFSQAQCNLNVGGKERPLMSLPQDLLRISKLSDDTPQHDDYTQVLLTCAEQALTPDSHLPSADTTLGLAFLLAVPQATDADSLFHKLPHVPLILRLASYYYSLRISALGGAGERGGTGRLSGTVSEVIEASRSAQPDEVTEELLKLLELYTRLLSDYSQAVQLEALGVAVNSHRFTSDDAYKRDIIFTLVRSLDSSRYEAAVAMANKYNIPLWDVYMEHVVFLFNDSGLSVKQLEKRLESYRFKETLVKQAERFASRVYTDIMPNVEGSALHKLLLMYHLVEGCPEPEGTTPTSEVHRKALHKLVTAAPGLNYKLLMGGEADPMGIIRPALKSGNVSVFSKLAEYIPTKDGGFLSSSAICAAWATRLFFEGSGTNSKTPGNTAAWILRYELCVDFISRMSPSDFVAFLSEVLFSRRALETIAVEARHEICRRGGKTCRGNTGKASFTPNERKSWQRAVDEVLRFTKHLQRMSSETLIALYHASDDRINKYHRQIDACVGNDQQLKEVLMTMLIEGQTLELLQDILDVMDLSDWTVCDALVQSLKRITQNLGIPGSSDSLSLIIATVGEHLSEGGSLVSVKDIMETLRPVLRDDETSLTVKLDIIDAIDKSLKLDEEDSIMVTLIQIKPFITQHWPHIKVTRDNVSAEPSRRSFFSHLISQSKSINQFIALPSIFQILPDFKDSSECWLELLTAMLDFEEVEIAEEYESADALDDTEELKEGFLAEQVVDLCVSQKLNDGVIQAVYGILLSRENVSQAALLAIQSKSPILEHEVVELICKHHLLFLEYHPQVLGAVFDADLVLNFTHDKECFRSLLQYLAGHGGAVGHRDAAGHEHAAGHGGAAGQSVRPDVQTTDGHSRNPNLLILRLADKPHLAKMVEQICLHKSGSATLHAAATAISSIGRWWGK